jgi:hypothetical protein
LLLGRRRICLPIVPDQAYSDLLIDCPAVASHLLRLGLLNGTLHLQSRAALPGLPPAISPRLSPKAWFGLRLE